MATIAAVLAYITCGRCTGTGQYHGYGICYGCRGTGKVSETATQAAARNAATEQHRRGDAARAASHAAWLASIDWTGATTCRYSSPACQTGACGACINGLVPDRKRNTLPPTC